MTIEELRRAAEDMEVQDLPAHAEEARDVMLMMAAKLGEVEARLDRVERRAGKERAA
jgi:hypothetical protein